jgi:hypothetical protein
MMVQFEWCTKKVICEMTHFWVRDVMPQFKCRMSASKTTPPHNRCRNLRKDDSARKIEQIASDVSPTSDVNAAKGE